MDARATRDAGGRRTPPRWWGLGLAVALGTGVGCLIPQDSQSLLDSIPQQLNRPPRILQDQVRPLESVIPDFGASMCTLDFSVLVEDPDVDDTLTVDWYVDYPTDGRVQHRNTLINTGQPIRAGSGELRVDLRAANSLLSSPGLHTVEALVADTRLLNDRQPEEHGHLDLPDGGTVVNPGFTTSYTWVVNTVQGDCR